MKKLNIKRMLAIGLAVAMLVPSAAMASSSNEGYAGPNNVVAGIDEGGNGGDSGGVAGDTVSQPAETDEAGSLPFTGADLGVLTAAGAILLALGFGLRRLTHRPHGA